MSFLSLSIFLYCCLNQSGGREVPRIAIVGGGMGGTTAAYELTQLSIKHGFEFHLDLYEHSKIGGRLATSFVNGFEFETGGSIIHNRNKYMNLFAEKFNFSKHHEPDEHSKNDLSAFYDGQEFVYVQSSSQLWSFAKFWWRYGWDLMKLSGQLIDPLLSYFERIYKLQADEKTFDNIHNFLTDLDPSFTPLLKLSIGDLLLSKGYSERFVNEFVFLATNINYNQNIDIHGFVGAVALAGAQSSLWSVEGGNKQIPETLLARSSANLIKKRVQSVYLMPNLKYALNVEDYAYVYDYVILACPVIENSKNEIQFQGFSSPVLIPVKYQRTVATLVHGELNATYFNHESLKHFPNNIFSVNNNLFFNSISTIDPVTFNTNYDRKVFKIFSKDVLTTEQLKSLFLIYDNNVTVIDWLAYPQYDTHDRNLTFVLYNNLFYVNAIEWTASAMEMSAISGVNAALHVMKQIKTNPQCKLLKKIAVQ